MRVCAMICDMLRLHGSVVNFLKLDIIFMKYYFYIFICVPETEIGAILK